MKKSIKGLWFVLLFTALIFWGSERIKGNDELNHCIIKYKSEWGKPCTQCGESTKSYRVYFRNDCDKPLDVKCAVQEMDKRWKTFTHLNLAANDTFVAYACKGTGKYMVWPRESGDNMVSFPSDEEINEKFAQ
jgi:hypothetical protein